MECQNCFEQRLFDPIDRVISREDEITRCDQCGNYKMKAAKCRICKIADGQERIKEQRPNDPEPIVWDVTAIAEEFGAEVIDEIPLCNHGPMILKQGNKDGKEYRGWVCTERDKSRQCPAKWMKIGSDGKWAFQR